jgi:ABC-2 type transport system permease protein
VLGSIFPTPAYRQQLLTGMLGLSVLFFGLTGIAFESLFQRNSGVYKLLRATPYRTLAFVTNLTAVRGIVALLSCVVVTVVGVLAFRIHVDIVGMLLILLAFTALALALAVITFCWDPDVPLIRRRPRVRTALL